MKSLEKLYRNHSPKPELVNKALKIAERALPPLRRFMDNRRAEDRLEPLLDQVTAHYYQMMVQDGFTSSRHAEWKMHDLGNPGAEPFITTKTWFEMHINVQAEKGQTFVGNLEWASRRGGHNMELEVRQTFPEKVPLPVNERIFRIEKSKWNGDASGKPGESTGYNFWRLNILNWNTARYSEDMSTSEAVGFLEELMTSKVDVEATEDLYRSHERWVGNHPQLKAVFWNKGRHPNQKILT